MARDELFSLFFYSFLADELEISKYFTVWERGMHLRVVEGLP